MPPTENPDGGTWIALFVLLLVAVALFGLMAIVAPPLMWLLYVLGGFAGFGALHYLLWGWWLGTTLQRRAEADDESGAASDNSGRLQ